MDGGEDAVKRSSDGSIMEGKPPIQKGNKIRRQTYMWSRHCPPVKSSIQQYSLTTLHPFWLYLAIKGRFQHQTIGHILDVLCCCLNIWVYAVLMDIMRARLSVLLHTMSSCKA